MIVEAVLAEVLAALSSADDVGGVVLAAVAEVADALAARAIVGIFEGAIWAFHGVRSGRGVRRGEGWRRSHLDRCGGRSCRVAAGTHCGGRLVAPWRRYGRE